MILKGRPRRRKYSCLLKEPDANIIGSIITAKMKYTQKPPVSAMEREEEKYPLVSSFKIGLVA
jgi:hypothetical protein